MSIVSPALFASAAASGPHDELSDAQLSQVLRAAFPTAASGERVLVLVPDTTRDVPMAKLLPLVLEALEGARSIDVMIALGTHPPMAPDKVDAWLGLGRGSATSPGSRLEPSNPAVSNPAVSSPAVPSPAVPSPAVPSPAVSKPAGRHGRGPAPTLHNHAWSDPSALATIGTVSEARLRQIAGRYWHRSLAGDLTIRVNRAALDADRVVVVGPTLPHEVAGYSGGAKYLFPGISGPEMIDIMHWLGALAGILATIGVEQTPVRELINEAADLLPTPVSLVALATAHSTDDEGPEKGPSSGEGLSGTERPGSGQGPGSGQRPGSLQPGPGRTVVNGIYAGELHSAWSASVAHAQRLHTKWCDRPYRRVISCAMPIYDELWTAGKAMYKLEPVVADGGELVIYAPHLSVVSTTHGRDLFDVGYHVLGYFLGQWPRFEGHSLAVLAHSTHVKGAGSYDRATATESPRVNVKLATAIPAEDCQRLNLGYESPAAVAAEIARPDQGTLVVPRAGEVLHRLR